MSVPWYYIYVLTFWVYDESSISMTRVTKMTIRYTNQKSRNLISNLGLKRSILLESIEWSEESETIIRVGYHVYYINKRTSNLDFLSYGHFGDLSHRNRRLIVIWSQCQYIYVHTRVPVNNVYEKFREVFILF